MAIAPLNPNVRAFIYPRADSSQDASTITSSGSFSYATTTAATSSVAGSSTTMSSSGAIFTPSLTTNTTQSTTGRATSTGISGTIKITSPSGISSSSGISTSPALSRMSQIAIISGSSAGGFLLLLVLIGFLCCHRYKRKRRRLAADLESEHKDKQVAQMAEVVDYERGCSRCSIGECAHDGGVEGINPEVVDKITLSTPSSNRKLKRKSLHEKIEQQTATATTPGKIRKSYMETLQPLKKERRNSRDVRALLGGSSSQLGTLDSPTEREMEMEEAMSHRGDSEFGISWGGPMTEKVLMHREDEPVLRDLLLERKRENEKFLVLPEPAYSRAVRPLRHPPSGPGG